MRSAGDDDMKPFHQWLGDLTEELKTDLDEDVIQSGEYDFFVVDGEPTYPCCVCGDDCPINCEPEEFDEDWHYCGKNPHCCP